MKDGQPAGTIEGVIVFQNVPKFAQMVGGAHTDTGMQVIAVHINLPGIVGGHPLIADLPLPKGIVNPTPYLSIMRHYSNSLTSLVLILPSPLPQPLWPQLP